MNKFKILNKGQSCYNPIYSFHRKTVNMFSKILIALIDLMGAIDKIHLALMLGWQDIKQRYRRSKLGPFWLTISMGIMITMIGIIFGQALSVPLDEYLPFIAAGIILWNFISTTIKEGSSAFIQSAGMIRQLALPLTLYPLRILWRNIIILAHNLIIFPLVLIVVGKGLTFNIFWVIPGLFLVILNIFWISVVLGTCCTRFRDLPPIVSSLIQVFFYLTPILWMPGSVRARVETWVVNTNPAYHLLELIRAPLLGNCPSLLSWEVTIISGILGSLFALFFFGKYKKRIAYWI